MQHTQPFGVYFDITVVLSIENTDTETSRKLTIALDQLKRTIEQ